MGDVIIIVISGVLGGFAGGLLGVGGGVIYISAMVLLLDEQQQVAQGVSLAAIIATAVVATITHSRSGNVDAGIVPLVAPLAIVAGFGAALLADAMDGAVLRRIFAVVATYFALTMIVGALRNMRVVATQD